MCLFYVMLKIHSSCIKDRLTTVLRMLVASFWILLAISSLVMGLINFNEEMSILPGLLNSLLYGAVAYGVYTSPHKYSSLSVLFLGFIGCIGGFYTHMHLTKPMEGRESLFTALWQWYSALSIVFIVCIASLILYLRSNFLYKMQQTDH